mmetsp:Transcript_1379/g.4039  ORF Transcript_1379/g.4039 Transcript_1379/m.4039 type:complete len:234 (-) Transcript_1379:153-854(-)
MSVRSVTSLAEISKEGLELTAVVGPLLAEGAEPPPARPKRRPKKEWSSALTAMTGFAALFVGCSPMLLLCVSLSMYSGLPPAADDAGAAAAGGKGGRGGKKAATHGSAHSHLHRPRAGNDSRGLNEPNQTFKVWPKAERHRGDDLREPEPSDSTEAPSEASATPADMHPRLGITAEMQARLAAPFGDGGGEGERREDGGAAPGRASVAPMGRFREGSLEAAAGEERRRAGGPS